MLKKTRVRPILRGLIVLLVLIRVEKVASLQDVPRGTISGVVMNENTQAPFAGVLVQVSGAGVATTDENGRFTFKDVPPGTHQIHALRTGMAPSARERSTSSITLGAGEDVRNIRLWLAPFGNIHGRITDIEDMPLRNLQVYALVVTYQEGRRVLAAPPEAGVGASPRAATDANGEYKLLLPAGKYFVGVDYRAPRTFGTFQILTAAPLQAGDTIRTYYPGTLDTRLAATVGLNGGDTFVADFRALRETPDSVRVSGTITGGPPLDPAAGPGVRMVTLTRLDVSSSEPMSTNYPLVGVATDRFEFPGVIRGIYEVGIGGRLADGRNGSARTTIEVKDRDLEDVVLALEPGQSVDGKVIVRGSSGSIAMDSIEIRAGGSAFATVARDGSFRLPDVQKGRRGIRVDGLPPGAYVADIRQGTVSLFDEARTLAGPEITVGSPDSLEIEIRPDGGSIDGGVESVNPLGPAGATVALVPGPSRRFVQSYYRSVRVGTSGEFSFRSLAPGVYQLFAWESVPATAWMNSEFMSAYEGRGQTVTVQAGRAESVRVRRVLREE